MLLRCGALWRGGRREASARQQRQRRDVLTARTEDPSLAELGLKPILARSDPTDVNYLELGVVRARSVCRVVQRVGSQLVGYGTGFLVALRIVLTNHHVIPDMAYARSSTGQFRYGGTSWLSRARRSTSPNRCGSPARMN
jgi:endonuclease G